MREQKGKIVFFPYTKTRVCVLLFFPEEIEMSATVYKFSGNVCVAAVNVCMQRESKLELKRVEERKESGFLLIT